MRLQIEADPRALQGIAAVQVRERPRAVAGVHPGLAEGEVEVEPILRGAGVGLREGDLHAVQILIAGREALQLGADIPGVGAGPVDGQGPFGGDGGFLGPADHAQGLGHLRPGVGMRRTQVRGAGETLQGAFAVSQGEQGRPASVVGGGEAGVQRQARIIFGQGFAVAAKRVEDGGAVAVVAGDSRLQRHRLGVAGERLFQPPEPAQQVATVGMGLGHPRLARDGRIVAGQRRLAASQLVQAVATAEHGFGMQWIASDRSID